MFQIAIDETIQCPIEDVFDRIANIPNYSEWLPREGIFRGTRQVSGGPVAVGTTYEDRTTLGTFKGSVVEYERPVKIVFQHQLRWLGIPVMQTRPEYTLQATDGVTTVYHSGEGQMYGVFKLLELRADYIAQQERERTVRALKESLEHERTRVEQQTSSIHD